MNRTSQQSRGMAVQQVENIFTRVGLRVMTAAALLALVVAASVIWLVLTEPVRVAGALADGEIRSVALALVSVFAGLGRALLAWL
jgi:hypothetical protein